MRLRSRYAAWWLDATISRETFVLFRTAFFAILGIDAFLQLSHAPRYGASDFNVANLPMLEALFPAPGREGMLLVWVLQAYLALRIAFGGATRSTAVLLCAAFGYGYFISQLDSYQHHYLVFLLLFLCCFVRWDRSDRLDGAWPIRAILVTISIVYVFAAVSKLEATWIDGQTLYLQVRKPWIHDLITSLGAIRIEGGELVDTGGYGPAAWIVVFTELALAVGIHVRHTWVRAATSIVGMAFHIGVEAAGFQIGLFSYFMVAIYLLVLPDPWLAKTKPAIDRIARALGSARTRLTSSWSVSWTFAAVSVGLGAAAIALLPFPNQWPSAAVIAALGVLGVWERRRGDAGKNRAVVAVAAAHLAACLGITAINLSSATARDYHRYWAASLRQMGNLEEAVPIYERAVKLAPDHAPSHNSLANLYRRTGRYAEAFDHYAIAQRLEPDNWRPYAGEAMAHDALGKGPEALAAAKKALALNPGHRRSREIAQKWAGSR